MRLASACRCDVGDWVRGLGLPIGGALDDHDDDDAAVAAAAGVAAAARAAGVAGGVGAAGAVAQQQARRLRWVLENRSVAILSGVPPEAVALLGRAEAACVRFFASPDAVKERCVAANTAAAPLGQLAAAGTDGAATPEQQPRPSPALAEARAGGAYRAHGPKWREQYHIVAGAFDACFLPAAATGGAATAAAPEAEAEEEAGAHAASAALRAALRPALAWYEELCLAVCELVLPGLRARLRAEAADRARGGDDPSVLDAFLYPNLARGTAEPNMSAHFDPGFLTVTVASSTPGLDVEVAGAGGGWLDIEAHADAGTELVCFFSESMRRAVTTAADAWRADDSSGSAAGGVPQPVVLACSAANHRVHRDASAGAAPRSSLVYELRSAYTGM